MKTPKQFSILLIDDDKVFLAALKQQLEKMLKPDTAVQTFTTGEACLMYMEEHQPSLILLDYFLNTTYPDAMNGLNVLKKIKCVSPDTKVVMLSAQDNVSVAVDTIKHGAYDYIIKDEKVFLRTKLVLMNVSNAVSDSTELKNFKLWAKIGSGLILFVIAMSAVLELNFPNIF